MRKHAINIFTPLMIVVSVVLIILVVYTTYTVATVAFPTTTKAPSSGPENNVKALCEDGMYSYSLRRQGTCASHGGVKEWL